MPNPFISPAYIVGNPNTADAPASVGSLPSPQQTQPAGQPTSLSPAPASSSSLAGSSPFSSALLASDSPGILGIIGTLMGHGTRAEMFRQRQLDQLQQARLGAARILTQNVQNGMPVNKAIMATLQTPEGIHLLSVDPQATTTLKTVLGIDNTNNLKIIGNTLVDVSDPAHPKQVFQAPPSPATVLNMGGEPEFNKIMAQNYAKQYNQIQSDGVSAASDLHDLQTMRKDISDQNFYSGAMANQALVAKRLAVAFGLADPNSVKSMEEFKALAAKTGYEAIGRHLGAGFSDADREFIISMIANLDNTPAGNTAMLDMLSRVAARKVQVANLAQDYLQKNGKLDVGFDKSLMGLMQSDPLFPEGWEQQHQPAPSGTPSNPEQGIVIDEGAANAPNPPPDKDGWVQLGNGVRMRVVTPPAKGGGINAGRAPGEPFSPNRMGPN